MKAGQQIELGFQTYSKAIGFIFSKGLWWAFFFPLGLNLLLFFGGFALVNSLTKDLQQWIIGLIGADGDLFLSEYLPGVIEVVIWILLKVLFFFIFAYYGGYIILALLSPLFAYLSERTEEIISGIHYPFNARQFVRDMLRGVLIVFRNLFFQTAWTILLFILGFIPIVGWIAPIALFVVSAYFYGFSFMDYCSERRKLKISASVSFIRTWKWLTIANGSLFCVFLLLPFCGVMLSGFMAIISVVAATLAVNQVAPVQSEN